MLIPARFDGFLTTEDLVKEISSPIKYGDMIHCCISFATRTSCPAPYKFSSDWIANPLLSMKAMTSTFDERMSQWMRA